VVGAGGRQISRSRRRAHDRARRNLRGKTAAARGFVKLKIKNDE